MKPSIPAKRLLKFQRTLRKDPERYFKRAFVDTIVTTMLLEDERISRKEAETIASPFIRSLSLHGTFNKYKS